MPVPERWRLPDDFLSDEDALDFVRENQPMDDPRWAPFNRLSARMVDYASLDECLAFLHRLDGDDLTDETIAELGTGLLDFLVEEYGTDCETALAEGVANANFRAMLECVSTLWSDVGEMLDRVLERPSRKRRSVPRADVSVLFTGDELDPSDVTRRTGVEPHRSGRRGELLRADHHLARRFGSWEWTTRGDGDVNVPLEEVLAVFELSAPVLDELRNEGIKTWLTVRWWEYDPRTADRFTSTPTTAVITRLAAIGLHPEIEVHRRASDRDPLA
jgi:hypothetical protein